MEELRLKLRGLPPLDLKANNIMAENERKEKEVVTMANARLPAETPQIWKGTAQQLCGTTPPDEGMLALAAGQIPQQSPRAISQVKIVKQSSQKEATPQNQKGIETSPVKQPK